MAMFFLISNIPIGVLIPSKIGNLHGTLFHPPTRTVASPSCYKTIGPLRVHEIVCTANEMAWDTFWHQYVIRIPPSNVYAKYGRMYFTVLRNGPEKH